MIKKILLIVFAFSFSSWAMPLVPFIPPKNNAAEAPDYNEMKEVPKDNLRKPQPLSTLKEDDFGSDENAEVPFEFEEDFNSLKIEKDTLE